MVLRPTLQFFCVFVQTISLAAPAINPSCLKKTKVTNATTTNADGAKPGHSLAPNGEIHKQIRHNKIKKIGHIGWCGDHTSNC